MNEQSDVMGSSGLRFFGEMSSANAHEIKNALAVINENAGLLEDLVMMAEKGASLDLDRFKRIACAIKKQVQRADHIAKSTNRFSHSVDKGQTAADLEQSIILVNDMASRYATLRDVHLQVETLQQAVSLPIRPFTLLHLLWLCLHASIKACEKGQVLKMAVEKTRTAVEIRYGPLNKLKDTFVSDLHAVPEMAMLLCSMSGTLSADPKAAFLKLKLNKK
jgi:hypothetical protein